MKRAGRSGDERPTGSRFQPVGGESGSTEIRELVLLYLKVLRAFGVFLKMFMAFGTPKLVEERHLATALILWLADCQI